MSDVYCSRGQHWLAATNFYPSTLKGRRAAWCKDCRREHQQELRKVQYEEAKKDPNWTQQCGRCGEWLGKECFPESRIGRKRGLYCSDCTSRYERLRTARGYRRPSVMIKTGRIEKPATCSHKQVTGSAAPQRHGHSGGKVVPQ